MGRGGFSDDDRKKLETVFTTVNNMSSSIGTYQTVLKMAVDVITSQAKHICMLNKELNMTNYRGDAQQQYGRKESIKVRNLNAALHGTDPVQIMKDIAKEIEAKGKDKDGNSLKVDLSEEHIQRCHFLGKNNKKLICKFIPYRMRMKILLNKKIINGAKEGKYKDVFIAEDLTLMRSRLVWYMKKQCKTKFTKLHTRDGVIKVKKEGKDSENDPWLSVSNPDDLFPHLDDGDDFDLELFNKDLYGFKVLPDIPDQTELEGLLELLESENV